MAKPQFPSVIDLNVGGRRLTTHLSTLTKETDSMLAKMFSGRHPQSDTKDKDGFYFLDADGEVFQHILNFLRNEEKPPRSISERVKHLAAYFGIQTLVDDLNKPSVVEFNVRGQIFPIERSTLEQMTNSVLDKMETGFQQAVKDKDGRFFIDADGKIFHYILDYIQHRSLPPVEFKAQIVNLSRTLGLTAVERVMMSEKFAQTS